MTAVTRSFLFAALFVPLALPAHAAKSKAPAAPPPDSVLAIVGPRIIGKTQFASDWSAMIPSDRPPGDALTSRRALLDVLVNRALLGELALSKHFALTPAESASYKEFRRRVLQNAYFDDIIGRRIQVDLSPAAIENYKRRLTQVPYLRAFRFPTLEQARTWKQRLSMGTPASRLEALAASGAPDAPVCDSLGYVAAEQLPDSLRTPLFDLRAGEFSDPIEVSDRFVLFQPLRFRVRPSVTAQRNDIPEMSAMMYSEKVNAARDAYRRRLREELDVRYDPTASEILVQAFLKLPPRVEYDAEGLGTVNANLPVPRIEPADTSRVLAQSRMDQLTIGQFLRYYASLEGIARPEVRNSSQLELAADRPLLDAEITRRSQAGRYDNDPDVVRQLQFRSESMAVNHYYESEIVGKVEMNPDSLRAYYDRHPGHWDSPPSITPRILVVESKPVADSLAALLRAGKGDFAAMATAWSIHESASRGGSVGVQYMGQTADSTLERILFNAPVAQTIGPVLIQGGYLVAQIDKKDPAVHRNFEESLVWVSNDYRTVKSEERLNAVLEGERKRVKPRTFPERITEDLGTD